MSCLSAGNPYMASPGAQSRIGDPAIVIFASIESPIPFLWSSCAIGRLLTDHCRIGLSFNLLALALLAHIFIPKARTYTYKFFHLCYQNPETGDYGVGFDDAYFISMCIVLFTGLRAAVMEYVLAPLAKVQGISKRKLLTRFTEQSWLIVYYSFFWPMGVVSLPNIANAHMAFC